MNTAQFKINKKHKKIIVLSLCAIAVVYAIYHIAYQLRTPAEFYSVRPYTAKDTQVFTGYIFREETVLTSYAGGLCTYNYYDGEKVPANRCVAEVYRYGNETVIRQITEIKKQIEILRRSMSLGRLTLSEVEQKIELVSYEITKKNAEGDTAAANTLSDELLVLMAKKDLLASGKSDYEAEIAVLKGQKTALEISLGIPSETVTAPCAGYFYAGTDGYEEILTSAAIDTLDMDTFTRLTQTAPTAKTNAIGTLLTSVQWYYVTKTTEKDAEGFLAGTSYDCLFLDNSYTESIPMKLVSKEVRNGEALLTFFASYLPRDFDLSRVQRIETTRHAYDGLRIPAETVRAENGITFVYVFDNGTAEKREVQILWEQNGYYIISKSFESESGLPHLKLNDLIIVNDTELYEGKFID